MSTYIHQLFPEDLRHAKVGKGKPRYNPPLILVLSKVSSGENSEDSILEMITVVLSQKTFEKVTLYEFDGVKTFLKM